MSDGSRWGEDERAPKPRRTSPWLWLLALLPLVVMLAAAIRGAPENSPEDQYRNKVEEGLRRSHDGDLAGAMESYQEARTLIPDQGLAEEAIGTVLLEQERYADCELWARRAVAARPDSGSAHVLLGLARDQLGDAEEAANEYRTAIRVAPESAAAYLNLGSLEAQRGNDSEASRLWQRYLELDPEGVDADKVRERLARLRSD